MNRIFDAPRTLNLLITNINTKMSKTTLGTTTIKLANIDIILISISLLMPCDYL